MGVQSRNNLFHSHFDASLAQPNLFDRISSSSTVHGSVDSLGERIRDRKMNISWKVPIVTIIIAGVSIIGLGIYGAWDGSQEQWHDTGKVTWVSQKYFVTPEFLNGYFAENFTITTLSHGTWGFTTDPSCNQHYHHPCPSQYSFNQAHLGDLVGLIHHRDNSTDLIF